MIFYLKISTINALAAKMTLEILNINFNGITKTKKKKKIKIH